MAVETRKTRGIRPVPDQLADESLRPFLEDMQRLMRDVAQSGVGGTTIINGGASAPGVPGPVGPPGPPGGEAEPDLTPPPTPDNLIVSAGFANIFVEWDAATYTQGHGNLQTNVYGAKYSGTGPLPTFSNAVLVGVAPQPSTIFVLATELGTQWHIWIKFQSRDGVESVSPAGGANGGQAATGRIGNTDLGPLIVEAGNLASGAVTATKLAASAIEFTKFAAGIEPVGVVNALPNPVGYAGPRTVVLTTDGKLYRLVSGAWTRAVDGADLIANSVVTGSIAAGAVTATQIAAGAVRVNSLLVVPASLCPDPYFADEAWWSATLLDANGWQFSTDGSIGAGKHVTLTSALVPSNGRKHVWSGRSSAAAVGASVRLRARMRNTTNQPIYVAARFENAAGTPVGDITLTSAPGSGQEDKSVLGATPTGAFAVRFIIYNEAGSVLTGNAQVSAVMLDVAASADLIVDGAIVASKLAANAIAVGSAAIQNGAIVNAMIANATIDNAKIASVSVSKLTAGSLQVGEYIQSPNYVSGLAGWHINGSGVAEFGAASIRGQLVASQIDSRGLTIRDTNGNVLLSAGTAYGTAPARGGYVNSDPLLQHPDEWQVDTFSGVAPSYYPNFNAGNGLGSAWDKTDGGKAYIFSARFPVSPLKTYVVESSLYAWGSIPATHYLLVAFYDISGAPIVAATFPGGWPGAGTFHYYGLVNAIAPSGGSRYSIRFGALATAKVPPNAAYARVGVLGGENGAAGRWSWGGAQVREVVDGQTLSITASNASTYIADAAIGTAQIGELHASRIVAGTITTDKIQIGDVSVVSGLLVNSVSGTLANASTQNLSVSLATGIVGTGVDMTYAGNVSFEIPGNMGASVHSVLVAATVLQTGSPLGNLIVAAGRQRCLKMPSGTPALGTVFTIPLTSKFSVGGAGSRNYQLDLTVFFLDSSGNLVVPGGAYGYLLNSQGYITENKV